MWTVLRNFTKKWKWCDFQIRGWVAFYYEAILFSNYWTTVEETKICLLNLGRWTLEGRAPRASRNADLALSMWVDHMSAMREGVQPFQIMRRHFLRCLPIMMYDMWSDPSGILLLFLDSDAHDYNTEKILLHLIPHLLCFQVGFGNVAGVLQRHKHSWYPSYICVKDL